MHFDSVKMSTMPSFQIEKLDDANYDSWCVHMRSIMVHSGTWKIVNGTNKLLGTMNAEQKATWEDQDERALASIMLSVKNSQLNLIKSCKTSNEAWVRLEETYKPRGPLQKVSLYKRLLNLAMPAGGNVSNHINAFMELNEKLSEIDITMKDELLVIMLLSSLPAEFEHFVIAIETRDSLPDFSTVKQKLLEEGNRRKEKREK